MRSRNKYNDIFLCIHFHENMRKYDFFAWISKLPLCTCFRKKKRDTQIHKNMFIAKISMFTVRLTVFVVSLFQLLLLHYKSDMNLQDNDGNSPLHLACANGHEEVK